MRYRLDLQMTIHCLQVYTVMAFVFDSVEISFGFVQDVKR